MSENENRETIDGVSVTEELIRAAVERAERGYDVEKLRGRGRPRIRPDSVSTVVPVRMDAELLAALNQKAEQDGMTRSEAIREAVRTWTHVA